MKTKLTLLFAACLALVGCVAPPAGKPSMAAQILTPANIQKATRESLQVAGGLVLNRNPSYIGEVQAAADVFTVLATSNVSALTPADIASSLSKTAISQSIQQDIVAGATLALTIYENNFNVNLPALKPQYAAFCQAVADGLNAAVAGTKLTPK